MLVLGGLHVLEDGVGWLAEPSLTSTSIFCLLWLSYGRALGSPVVALVGEGFWPEIGNTPTHSCMNYDIDSKEPKSTEDRRE